MNKDEHKGLEPSNMGLEALKIGIELNIFFVGEQPHTKKMARIIYSSTFIGFYWLILFDLFRALDLSR